MSKQDRSFVLRGGDLTGFTLLLVILVMSAILSVSIGIFDLTFGESRISGEVGDSFLAFYAADQGAEKILYDDRVSDAICPGNGSCSYGPVNIPFDNGSCASVRLSRSGGGNTTIISTGQFPCPASDLSAKRAVSASYVKSEP